MRWLPWPHVAVVSDFESWIFDFEFEDFGEVCLAGFNEAKQNPSLFFQATVPREQWLFLFGQCSQVWARILKS